jgi:4-hydroxy-4-methyl-2-oxoglutarate aldolase
MQPRLDLQALSRISSPTISNAIEMFDIRPRNEGFIGPEVRCLFPGLGRMVGYASTAAISADLPAVGRRKLARSEYWESTQEVPAPRVAVIQDLDNPPGRGAFWGEVNSNIHRSLGFIGVVTNGSARDLEEMEGLGFFAFAGTPSVSHSYVHLVDCGAPVRIAGAVVSPGTLLHGDRHGVVTIPLEIAPLVVQAAADVEAAERELISYCQSREFDLAGLKNAYTRLEERFLEIMRNQRSH